ncbi:Uncharacterized protein SAPIO_CDS6324 [Scedosporium apiospermum]|uniref:Short-chain dehydrogenase n=1 Tax=Pseudallescheria apiosperma TaxID=563466 RepID=A0A084G427_PSEDA|nr:Uncharacterized protein SAPIO_CDS6324 [Scedosporium apiospermum]KEZ42089.1 Uncharacterized protein SAPIO_CDS6324 [Scedosporium apiospermum]
MPSFSREGFTIDVVGRAVRKTLLNPTLSIPLALAIRWALSRGSIHDVKVLQRLENTRRLVYLLAAFGAFLNANEYLNRQVNNNWTSKSQWDWDNKEIIVVTGGSSGIGANLIGKLLDRNPNTRIVVIDFAPLAWEPPKGARIHYYQCDLSDSASLHAVCEQIRQEVGHPTVLVNNAGICRGYTICDSAPIDVEATIRTNLTAPFLLVKEFLPEMIHNNHGHIVNISSMSAYIPPSKMGDYGATKAGVLSMHEALQLELANIHKAPNVRLSVGIFSFIRTQLIRGETRQFNFLFPVLDVNTVAQALADTIHSGYGRTIYLPGIMSYVAILRGGPEWLWRMIRQETNKFALDFTGRQRVDPETGRISAI